MNHSIQNQSNAERNGEIRSEISIANGNFSSIDVRSLVDDLIDGNIGALNLQEMKAWESDHSCSTQDIRQRVQDLKAQKKTLAQLLADPKHHNVQIDLVVRMSPTR